jgi:hypothetical protein
MSRNAKNRLAATALILTILGLLAITQGPNSRINATISPRIDAKPEVIRPGPPRSLFDGRMQEYQ